MDDGPCQLMSVIGNFISAEVIVLDFRKKGRVGARGRYTQENLVKITILSCQTRYIYLSHGSYTCSQSSFSFLFLEGVTWHKQKLGSIYT